jgi:hypothetical protein
MIRSVRENICVTHRLISVFKDSAWFLLLMADDEFSRAESSHFRLLHPKPATVLRYLSMYRSHRFSGTSVGPLSCSAVTCSIFKTDHLLARWVLDKHSDIRAANRRIPARLVVRRLWFFAINNVFVPGFGYLHLQKKMHRACRSQVHG